MMDYGEYNTAFDLALWDAYRAAVGLAQPERVHPEDSPLPERARPAKCNHNKRPDAPPRTYKSRFVGVTEHRNRWIAQWGERGAVKSSVYPFTPEGEAQAAQARADALGRDYLELRPPEQVRGTPEAAAATEARGRGRKAISGRRIG